ncbi:MAG: oligosaccharide flippase family protein [Cytophagaceae bacterium]|nr:oligosaccharide flippase family protein [Cytophagaceae bacterium]MDW8455880.1 oligosaccharide flippase family protein [Cytophagaceae bacterium]
MTDFIQMGIVAKRGIQSSIINYIGVLIGVLNVLFLFPKYLSPEQFGLFRLLQDIPWFFALFVQLGASSVTDRFFQYFKDEQKKNNGFLLLILLYPLVGYILFVSIFFGFASYWKSFYAERSPLVVDYFFYIAPLTLFIMYSVILEAYLRAHLNVLFSNFLREVLIRIFFCIMIALFATDIINFDQFVFLLTVSYGINMLLILLYIRKKKLLWLNCNFGFKRNQSIYRNILKYLLYLIPASAGGVIAQKIDSMMLGSISGKGVNEGLVHVAIYALAFHIASFIEVPRRSINQISIPLLSKAFKENDLTQVNILYKKNSLIQFLSGVFIFSLVWININEIFFLLPKGHVYVAGKYVLLIIGLARLIDMVTSINSEVIQFSEHYRFNTLAVVILGVSTIVFNLIFIPNIAIIGAAIALFISVSLYNYIKTYYIWKKLHIHPFSSSMIPLVLILSISILAEWVLPNARQGYMAATGTVLLRSILYVVCFYIVFRKLRISEDANLLVESIIKKLSKRKYLAWTKMLL